MHGDERRFLFVDFDAEIGDHHIDDVFGDLVFILVEIAYVEGKHRIETDAVVVALDAGIDVIGQRDQDPLGDLSGTAAGDVIRCLDSELYNIIGDLIEKGSQSRIDAFALKDISLFDLQRIDLLTDSSVESDTFAKDDHFPVIILRDDNIVVDDLFDFHLFPPDNKNLSTQKQANRYCSFDNKPFYQSQYTIMTKLLQ